MSAPRMWIGPVGSVPVGNDAGGAPIAASLEHGVGPMTEVGGVATVTLADLTPHIAELTAAVTYDLRGRERPHRSAMHAAYRAKTRRRNRR